MDQVIVVKMRSIVVISAKFCVKKSSICLTLVHFIYMCLMLKLSGLYTTVQKRYDLSLRY